MTRSELKSKYILKSGDALLNMDTVDDFAVIHNNALDALIEEAYIEGTKAAMAHGGHKPDNLKAFLENNLDLNDSVVT